MTVENETELTLTDLLTKIEDDCRRLENRYHLAREEWEAKLEERDIIFKSLELLHRYSPPSSQASTPIVDERLRQRMSGKTVKEMIIELAKESENQMFKVVDINKKLVLAGMFADTTKAAEGVYSTLGRNPKSFIRIEKGRYLVAPSAIETSSERTSSDGVGDADIVNRVQAVLREHPTWDRRQVTDELQRQGFNFGSRKPIFAVGAVFMRLKRGSKDRAQPTLRSIS